VTGILYRLAAFSKTSWLRASFPRAASARACPIALESGHRLSRPGKSLAHRKLRKPTASRSTSRDVPPRSGHGPNDDCFDGYPELSIEDWHKKHGLWIE